MKNSKNNRTIILIVVLLGLLILAYKVMFVSPNDSALVDDNIAASVRVENILQQVKDISFDTSILRDQKKTSLKSIEIPLVSLPIGRKNPFSGISGSN